MDVNIGVLEGVGVYAQLLCAGTDQTDSGLRGFAHHVADMPSEPDVAAPGVACGLNVKNFSAHGRKCQTRHDAGFAGFEAALANISLWPKNVLHLFGP